MKRLSILVTAAALVVGLSGAYAATGGHVGGAGDRIAEPAPFTIVTAVDFLTDPFSATFKVEQGSDALGCSGGKFVDHPLAEGDFGTGQSGGVLLKVLTCTNGERSGSFLIHFEMAFERWRFHGGTGDFTAVEGRGHYFMRRGDFAGIETLCGTVRF